MLRLIFAASVIAMQAAGECTAPDADACVASPIKRAREDDRLMDKTGGVDSSDHGPFDCHGRGSEVSGRGCHSECEARHLDDIERTRFEPGSGFRYPRQPSVVIAASRDMGRTASTWVFNAIRLLYRQAQEACDSYWMRRLTPEKIQKRLETGAHVLIKTHEWTDSLRPAEFDRVKPLFSHVIVSVRDGFPEDPDWMKHATHVTHFEDIVRPATEGGDSGAIGVLRNMADHLGITSLTDKDLREVDYALMTLPMPTSGCNQTTKLWPFHSRRGGRPPPEQPPE